MKETLEYPNIGLYLESLDSLLLAEKRISKFRSYHPVINVFYTALLLLLSITVLEPGIYISDILKSEMFWYIIIFWAVFMVYFSLVAPMEGDEKRILYLSAEVRKKIHTVYLFWIAMDSAVLVTAIVTTMALFFYPLIIMSWLINLPGINYDYFPIGGFPVLTTFCFFMWYLLFKFKITKLDVIYKTIKEKEQ